MSRTPDDELAARDALRALDEAFALSDPDAVLGLCTDDIVFIGSGDGEEAVGHKGLVEMLTRLADRAEGTELTVAWGAVDADVRGDIAFLAAWGTARLATPGRNRELRYRLTGVLVRTGDRWLWRVYHGSEPAIS